METSRAQPIIINKMNPILLGALAGVLWGIILLLNLTIPEGAARNIPFGVWLVLGIAFLFVCGTIIWMFRWFTGHK